MKDPFDGRPEENPGQWPNDDFLDDGYAFDVPDDTEDSSDPEWFLDYFEGVLEPAERGRIDRMLAADTALARRFDSYCRRVELLRAVGDAERRVDGGSALRARILADVARQLPPVRRSGSRFAWVASVGLAAASLVVFFALERSGPAPDSVARYDETSNHEIMETALPSESAKDAEQPSFARLARGSDPKSGDSKAEGQPGERSTDAFAGAISKVGLDRERTAIDGAQKDDADKGASLRVLHLGEGGPPKGAPGDPDDRDAGSNESGDFGTLSILRLAEKELLAGSRAGALEDGAPADRSVTQESRSSGELERKAEFPTAGGGGAGPTGGRHDGDGRRLLRKVSKQVDIETGLAANPENGRAPSPGGPTSQGPSSPGPSLQGASAPSGPVSKGPVSKGPVSKGTETGALAVGAKKHPNADPDSVPLELQRAVTSQAATGELEFAALHIEVPRADLPRFYDWVASSQLEAQPLVGGANLVAFAATTPVGWMTPRETDKLGSAVERRKGDDAVRGQMLFDTGNVSIVAPPRPGELDRLLRIGGERAALVRGAAVLLAKSEWRPAETVVHFGVPRAGLSLGRGFEFEFAKGAPSDQASRPGPERDARQQTEDEETQDYEQREQRSKSVDLDREATQRARLATRALRADTAQSVEPLMTFGQIHEALRRAASANSPSLLIYLRVVEDGTRPVGPVRQAPFVPPVTAPESERVRGKK